MYLQKEAYLPKNLQIVLIVIPSHQPLQNGLICAFQKNRGLSKKQERVVYRSCFYVGHIILIVVGYALLHDDPGFKLNFECILVYNFNSLQKSAH
jgi:hypothetical protein